MDRIDLTSLQSLLAEAENLRQQDRAEDACAVLLSAAARYPDAATPWCELAQLAEAGGHWTEAEGCWRRHLQLDDGQWSAHASLARVLRAQGRPAEANSVLTAAEDRFPDEIRTFEEGEAREAESRAYWSEAARLWAVVRVRSPDAWLGYAGQARALREQEKWDDADQVLTIARTHLPNELAAFVEHARLAEARHDRAESLRRWGATMERFPDAWQAHVGKVRALQAMDCTDEAWALLSEATVRFPREFIVWHDLARTAEWLKRWSPAEAAWRRCLALDRGLWWVHRALAVVLLEQRRWDEAEALTAEAQQWFPKERFAFAADHAAIAEARDDQAEALRRWNAVSALFSGEPAGPAGQARVLCRLARADEADSVVEAAMRRWPESVELARQFGQNAVARMDWSQAVDRLLAANRRFQWSDPVRMDLYEARLRVLESESALHDPGVAASGPGHAAESAAEVAAKFESLGGGVPMEGGWAFGCEFGLFQRDAGVEPIGLLRWVSIAPTSLATAFECRFAGIDSPDDLVMRRQPGATDWAFHQMRYKMVVDHTNLSLLTISEPEAHRRVRRLIAYLANKLTTDLENDEKIFVYRTIGQDIDEAVLERLARAVASYGRNRFLFVKQTSDARRQFTIETRRPGFFIGYIDRFSTDGEDQPISLNHPGWAKLCRVALATQGL